MASVSNLSLLCADVRVSRAARQLPSSCLTLGALGLEQTLQLNKVPQKVLLLLLAFDMEMRGNGACHPGFVPSRLVCLKIIEWHFLKLTHSNLLQCQCFTSSRPSLPHCHSVLTLPITQHTPHQP